jgi:ubiquinone/menaquinone biosynthesis C-methylase UbiE
MRPRTEKPDETTADLGLKSHVDALQTIVGNVSGLKTVDIGCGEGLVVRELLKLGATSKGVDPLVTPGEPSLIQGYADAVPLPSACFDLVTFIFSLHHIPSDRLSSSLKEARRLLSAKGRLYVAEPLASGLFQHVIEPFHDETKVRVEAASALHREMPSLFENRLVVHYTERRMFSDFDQFADRMIAKASFNRYQASDVRSTEVRRRFDEIFARCGGAFDQPVRVDFYF